LSNLLPKEFEVRYSNDDDDSIIGLVYRTGTGRVAAEIICLDDEEEINVKDELVYKVMKQFGEEFGYSILVKDWDGAGKGEASQKPKQKMMEMERTSPRYERLNK